MLKITIHREAGTKRLTLEGRLAGAWVDEVDRCWKGLADTGASRAVVDLSGVTFIAYEGKALLTRMWQQGVKLHAAGCLTSCIVEEVMKKDPSKRS